MELSLVFWHSRVLQDAKHNASCQKHASVSNSDLCHHEPYRASLVRQPHFATHLFERSKSESRQLWIRFCFRWQLVTENHAVFLQNATGCHLLSLDSRLWWACHGTEFGVLTLQSASRCQAQRIMPETCLCHQQLVVSSLAMKSFEGRAALFCNIIVFTCMILSHHLSSYWGLLTLNWFRTSWLPPLQSTIPDQGHCCSEAARASRLFDHWGLS